MEIHIDTNRDSKEDIQKLIGFLQSWVEQSDVTSQTGEPLSQVPELFGLFDTPRTPVSSEDSPAKPSESSNPSSTMQIIPDYSAPSRPRVIPY